MRTPQQLEQQMDVHQHAWESKLKEIADRVKEGGAEQSAEEKAFVEQHMDAFDKLDKEKKDMLAASAAREALEQRAASYGKQRVGAPRDTERQPLQPQREQRDEPKAMHLRLPSGNYGPSAERFREHAFSAHDPVGRRMHADYEREFMNYVLTGVPGATMQTTTGPGGGYLTPSRMAAEFIRAVTDDTYMRQICRVLPPIPDAVSMGVLSLDTRPGVATWGPEVRATAQAAATDAAFGKREMHPHLQTLLLEVGERLVRTATINIESFVQDEMVRNIGELEEEAFLTGSGAFRPLGVFTASAQGIPSGDVTTGAGRDFTCNTAVADKFNDEDVIDMLYALKAQYQRNATWLVSRAWLKHVRKMKSGDGVPFWNRTLGLQGNTVPTILDRPYVVSEFVPSTFTAGAYVACLGDFSFYWVLDSLGMTFDRLTDSAYKLKNQIGMLLRKETDGMPVLSEAFVRMKLAAS